MLKNGWSECSSKKQSITCPVLNYHCKALFYTSVRHSLPRHAKATSFNPNNWFNHMHHCATLEKKTNKMWTQKRRDIRYRCWYQKGINSRHSIVCLHFLVAKLCSVNFWRIVMYNVALIKNKIIYITSKSVSSISLTDTVSINNE